MKALFLGSIGVIAETSELQRQAYNSAFAEYGLDWYWSVGNYCEMLKRPGGKKRISAFSNLGLDEDLIQNIHLRKQAIYTEMLDGGIAPRAGLVECIAKCQEQGVKLGLITTTTQANINALSHAMKKHVDFKAFDLITIKDDVSAEKPNGEVYRYALEKLGVSAPDVLAVEDTEANQTAAMHEHIICYLFAGEYATTTHNLNAINNLEILTGQL